MKVKLKRFTSNVRILTRTTPGSACFDVYSAENIMLEPGVRKPIKLDFGMKFAKKYVCRLYPRSDLSLKLLSLGEGVVDSDYRGNVSVILTNFSSWKIDIEQGDRIAQMTFFKERRGRFC